MTSGTTCEGTINTFYFYTRLSDPLKMLDSQCMYRIIGHNKFHCYLVRSQASDNNHLLEVRKLFRPWSRKRSSVRFFTIVDLTPLVRVTHKTFPAKFYIPMINMLGKSVRCACHNEHKIRTRSSEERFYRYQCRVIHRNSAQTVKFWFHWKLFSNLWVFYVRSRYSTSHDRCPM